MAETRAARGGASHAGLGSNTPSLMTRRRPERSATRIVCASGNARLYGCTSPPATWVTLIRWPVAVSSSTESAGRDFGGPWAITTGGRRNSAARAAARETDVVTWEAYSKIWLLRSS